MEEPGALTSQLPSAGTLCTRTYTCIVASFTGRWSGLSAVLRKWPAAFCGGKGAARLLTYPAAKWDDRERRDESIKLRSVGDGLKSSKLLQRPEGMLQRNRRAARVGAEREVIPTWSQTNRKVYA